MKVKKYLKVKKKIPVKININNKKMNITGIAMSISCNTVGGKKNKKTSTKPNVGIAVFWSSHLPERME